MAWPGPVYFPELLWDESEHPRHPRGTSRGGQFRSKVGGSIGLVSSGTERWIQTALTGVGIDLDEDDLLDVVTRGREVGRTPLHGGNVGVTSIVTFEMPDGQQIAVVHKRQDPEYSDLEVWSSRIGRAIGAPVPAVIHDPDDEDSIYLPYIEGHSALQRAAAMVEDEDAGGGAVYDIQSDLTEEHGRTRRGALLGLLDVALLNADRHGGNWMIDIEGQAWGIDHTHIEPWFDGEYEGYEDFGELVSRGEGPLTADDIAQARAQIGDLVDQNRIPQEWHLPMDERLKRLEQTYRQPAYSFPGGAY